MSLKLTQIQEKEIQMCPLMARVTTNLGAFKNNYRNAVQWYMYVYMHIHG